MLVHEASEFNSSVEPNKQTMLNFTWPSRFHGLMQKSTYLQNVFIPQCQNFNYNMPLPNHAVVMTVDDCIFPLHDRHDDKSLCHFDATKAMSTLHELACRVDMKNISVRYEQKLPRNGTSRYKHRSIHRTGSLAEEGLVLNSNSQNTRTAVYFRAFSTWWLRRQIFPEHTMNWIFLFVVRLCSSPNVNMRVSVGKEQRQSTTR